MLCDAVQCSAVQCSAGGHSASTGLHTQAAGRIWCAAAHSATYVHKAPVPTTTTTRMGPTNPIPSARRAVSLAAGDLTVTSSHCSLLYALPLQRQVMSAREYTSSSTPLSLTTGSADTFNVAARDEDEGLGCWVRQAAARRRGERTPTRCGACMHASMSGSRGMSQAQARRWGVLLAAGCGAHPGIQKKTQGADERR